MYNMLSMFKVQHDDIDFFQHVDMRACLRQKLFHFSVCASAVREPLRGQMPAMPPGKLALDAMRAARHSFLLLLIEE